METQEIGLSSSCIVEWPTEEGPSGLEGDLVYCAILVRIRNPKGHYDPPGFYLTRDEEFKAECPEKMHG